MPLSPEALISLFQTWPPEALLILTCLLCYGVILLFARLFGMVGLYVYVAVAILAANLQVLKVVQFSFFNFPIALGTAVFSSIFLTVDILTEYFGRKAAQKAIWLSFASALLLLSLMTLTLGYSPLPQTAGSTQPSPHEALFVLFTPAPAIFGASLLSYLVSQHSDVWIFEFIKKLTHKRFLWLRTTLSTWISAFLDNCLFSLLAWVIFAPVPMAWETLVWTYILGTLILRLGVSLLYTPLIYLSKHCLTFKNEPSLSSV